MQSEQRAEQKLCPTYSIRDQVATEDEFRHEVVATSIADMILSDSGGCAIALTGSWGSGKSTVVRLLADELARRGEVQTFVFDAWAHQGDPLRRTFLEKLIQWCNEETREWTKNKAHWNKRIDELAKRSETVQTKSAPRLTRWGMAGALALLITPIALQIYQKISYSSHPVWEWVAIIASGLPIFVAAFLLLDWYISQHGKPPDRRQPIPNLLFTSSENNITSTSSKTPDPTSVEFEQTYRELLGEALEDKKRQIVLVIDNLDRVNHSDARSIWATLRVFFESSLDGTLDWRKRVWVLVPFDPDAIRDLWDGSADKAALSSNSQHFLEKTFQAISSSANYPLQPQGIPDEATPSGISEPHRLRLLCDISPL